MSEINLTSINGSRFQMKAPISRADIAAKRAYFQEQYNNDFASALQKIAEDVAVQVVQRGLCEDKFPFDPEFKVDFYILSSKSRLPFACFARRVEELLRTVYLQEEDYQISSRQEGPDHSKFVFTITQPLKAIPSMVFATAPDFK